MTEREAVALTRLILSQRIAEVSGGAARLLMPTGKARTKSAAEQLADLEVHEAVLRSRVQQLEEEKRVAFAEFRAVVKVEQKEKKEAKALAQVGSPTPHRPPDARPPPPTVAVFAGRACSRGGKGA